MNKEAHFLNTVYGTRLYTCPCGCAVLITPDRPEGPFATWVQGCEEEQRLYKDLFYTATPGHLPDGRVLIPEPMDVRHVSALHFDHLRDGLLALGNGIEEIMSLIYYPFGGLPTDWRDRLNWRTGDASVAPGSNK